MEEAIEYLVKTLISYKTEQGNTVAIDHCLQFIGDYCGSYGLRKTSYSCNGFPSLVIAKEQKKHYQFLLVGHIDVVHAESEDAYLAVKRGSRIYGRGSADMKGGVAVLMQLLVELAETVDVALILTSDEEIGGGNGVDYLLNNLGYSCECAIIPDGGNNYNLVTAQKGVIQCVLTAKGKLAHGARVWAGDNAIEKLIAVYGSLKKAFPDPTESFQWKTTVSLGKLTGGTSINMVPDFAEMYLDIRFIDIVDEKKIYHLLSQFCKKDTGLHCRVLAEGNLMQTTLDSVYIRNFLHIATKHSILIQEERTNTSSDARYFTQKNIPTIVCNPICSPGHIEEEWVDMESLVTYSYLLRDFLVLGQG